MAYVSLYRKWRPQSFEDVVDQKFVVRTLSNALKNGRFTHAYLFAGPRGTGKTSIARILAKALNCEQGPTPNPCNVCESCRRISDGTALDVIEIDAASNRGIDDVRELRDKVAFSPTVSRMKIYIIDEVHMLTNEAFNALLKMLEEPPSHVVFVLATTEPHKVPPTIASRCQPYDFKRVPTPELARHLERIAGEEGIALTKEGAALVARSAQGSVRDALVSLDQLASYADGEVSPEIVADFLGLVEADALFELGDLVARGDSAGLLRLVGRVEDRGKDLVQFARGTIEHFRRIFMIQNTDAEPEFLDLSDEEYDGLKRQADALDRREVPGYLRILQETVVEMKSSGSPRMMLEMGLVRMARPDLEISPEALALRLEKLEERLDGLSLEPLPAPPEPVDAGRKKASPPAAEEPPAPSPGGGEKPPPSPDRPRPSTDGARRAPVGGPPEEAGVIDIATVKRAWPKVKERVKEKNRPLHAQLMDGIPAAVRGDRLYLRFHAGSEASFDRISEEEHRRTVEESLREVLRVDLELHPMLEGGASEAARAREEKEAPLPPRRAPRAGTPGPAEPSPTAAPPGGPGTGGAGLAAKEPPAEQEPEPEPPPEPEREPGPAPPPPPPPKKKPKAARPPGEVHEKRAVRMVKDVFDGAEIVEEVHLQTPEGEHLHE